MILLYNRLLYKRFLLYHLFHDENRVTSLFPQLGLYGRWELQRTTNGKLATRHHEREHGTPINAVNERKGRADAGVSERGGRHFPICAPPPPFSKAYGLNHLMQLCCALFLLRVNAASGFGSRQGRTLLQYQPSME